MDGCTCEVEWSVVVVLVMVIGLQRIVSYLGPNRVHQD